MKWLKQFLGLKGSWYWACKQMKKGKIVYRFTDIGCARYKTDNEGQNRILWAFERFPNTKTEWSNAFIFMSDFTNTNWVVYK